MLKFETIPSCASHMKNKCEKVPEQYDITCLNGYQLQKVINLPYLPATSHHVDKSVNIYPVITL